MTLSSEGGDAVAKANIHKKTAGIIYKKYYCKKKF